MNKIWHAEHKMPPKATLEQRIHWHKEHQIHCACREAPASLQPALEKIAKTAQPKAAGGQTATDTATKAFST